MLIKKPDRCLLCNYNSISIIKNNTINKPYAARYSNSHCKNIFYLRQNSFLDEFPRTAASIILYILKLWIRDDKNAVEIFSHIKETIIDSEISQDKINKIL